MRISQDEIQHIIDVLASFLSNETAELRLFGSRVNDQAKGGDIDLLLLVDNQQRVRALLLEKHRILAMLKKYLGDQKIDLKIATKMETNSDPFLQIIVPQSILLHHYIKSGA